MMIYKQRKPKSMILFARAYRWNAPASMQIEGGELRVTFARKRAKPITVKSLRGAGILRARSPKIEKFKARKLAAARAANAQARATKMAEAIFDELSPELASIAQATA